MTLTPIDAASLRLADHIRPGDLVSWGQGMAEPLALIGKYTRDRHEFAPTRAFVGLSLGQNLTAEHTDAITLMSYGALGALAPLYNAGLVQMVPCRYSALPGLIRLGVLRPDVLFIQISPPGPDGSHSLGWCNDVLPVAMRHARVVLAEINPAVPWVRMDAPLDESLITATIHSNLALPQFHTPAPGEAETAIAQLLGARIPDGATLQYGIGAIPSAILKALQGHRDLGLHSGLVTDEIVDLAECGALNNARKPGMTGISVGAVAIGSQKLANFMADNSAFCLSQTHVTHGAAQLAQLSNLVAVNSALEVDLLGQVNAEQVGNRYLGAIGGQPDFMHAATSARDGLSVIAMPATSAKGSRSRIVARLTGPQVTTARSDVDLVVTEYGVADLRGLTLAERSKALIALAAPDHREDLSRDAHYSEASR